MPIERCPSCGKVIKPEWREIPLDKAMTIGLGKAFLWCVKNDRHEFTMKDIRSSLNHSQYARFNDWTKFGGLVYKEQTRYGLNMARTHEFLMGRSSLPARVWKSSKTGQLKSEGMITISEIPDAMEFLDDAGVYKVQYTNDEPGSGR